MHFLQGELALPGDKSISHRALMLLGISNGRAQIHNSASGADVLSTLRCMKAFGCQIHPIDENTYRVDGITALKSPSIPLDCGNSGTTIRLLSGLIAGSNIAACLTGDESLQKRPMRRIIQPLSQMGAAIHSLEKNDCAPLQFQPVPQGLHAIHYTLPMASAQVKSAILLAGLFLPPHEHVIIKEPLPSRDHTERMLSALGVPLSIEGEQITLLGRQHDLISKDIQIPGDISSAAFWMIGAAILPGSKIHLKGVGLNPLRLGVLNILKMIGTKITLIDSFESTGEPYGDLLIENQDLKGDIEIQPDIVPALIDEIPILTMLGLFTDGVFTLRGAEELRYKESDRLNALIEILQALKIDIITYPDGFSFQGNPSWQIPKINISLKTYHDHRLVMALEILSLRASEKFYIEGSEWVSISYPGFYATLENLLTNKIRLR